MNQRESSKGSRVALYGSRARGDSKTDSDWDLHVLVPGNEKLPLASWDDYGWPFEQLGWEYGEWIMPPSLFGCRVAKTLFPSILQECGA